MCYYRYHYYSQCAHEELYCFRFCDQAEDLKRYQVKKEESDTFLEATRGKERSRHNHLMPCPPTKLDRLRIVSGKESPTTSSSGKFNTIHQDPSFADPYQISSTSPWLPNQLSPPSCKHHSPAEGNRAGSLPVIFDPRTSLPPRMPHMVSGTPEIWALRSTNDTLRCG